MTEYTSIRVTQSAKDAAAESKRDGETWNDYLQRCTDNPPEVREFVDAERVDAPDTVALEASERRAIAEEVVGMLR